MNNHAMNLCIAALLAAASLAAVAAGANPAPPEEQLRAMSRLHHWTGLWQGEGWAMTGPGQRQDFKITERVSTKLGGSVLLAEGRGTSTGDDGVEFVTHEALGVVYYDEAAQRYNFQTHDLSGRANEVELEVAQDGVMRWAFRDERSGALLRFKIAIEGDHWRETGEVSPDQGQNWYPMLDMTLTREPIPEGSE